MPEAEYVLNRDEVAERIADRCGVKKKDVISVLDELGEELRRVVLLDGGEVRLHGIGTFCRGETKPCERADNFSGKGVITTTGKRRVRFKPGKKLKQALEQ